MNDFIRRHRLTVTLPIVWVVTSLISFAHPGDEYGLYFVSNILGAWVAMVFDAGDIHDLWIRGSVAIAGGLVVAGLGYLLDRLRVAMTAYFVVWLTTSGLFLYGFLSSFKQIEDALAKNGSWTAYLSASSNLGITFACLLCLFSALLLRAYRRSGSRRPKL
jgi:hypothetical protein